jgi:hypothetical protein
MGLVVDVETTVTRDRAAAGALATPDDRELLDHVVE